MKKKQTKDAYAGAGVNIDAGHEAVKRMKNYVRLARTKNVVNDLGAFGGLFSLPKNYKQPILVSSTDGVGTKVMLASKMNKYDTVGQDLVNHCVNDILVQGAKPLFFMDYFATGKLKPRVAAEIVKGLAKACRENQCALLGGETAEMPGIYRGDDFDLAGTIVGIVEKKQIIDGKKIKPGDVVIGLASNGLHTNGYSLARKILFTQLKLKLSSFIPDLSNKIGEELLRVHRSYLSVILDLLKIDAIRGLAHITGGGLLDNIPRILPSKCGVVIQKNAWKIPTIFKYLKAAGKVDPNTMYRTFNMGIGMVLIVAASKVNKVMLKLKTSREKAYIIGEVKVGPRKVKIV